MATIDVMQLAAILREAAKSQIMPRWRRLTPDMVHTKSMASDLVTEADVESERLIKARVAALWPAASFIGEESVAADPALLHAVAGAELAVIVDPVDGTGNFAAGMPLFAVMAAVVAKGETVAGLIYDPFADDFVMAEKGSGAWVRRADGTGIRLQVAEPAPLAEMVGTSSMTYLAPARRVGILPNLAKVQVASAYRCAGHEYRAFASGHLHFSFFSKLMPWDHLAGSLIVSEGGGCVRLLDGRPYTPADNSTDLLIATDPDSWDLLRREVFAL